MDNKLASERIVVSAPMSFHGSAARIWKLTAVSNPYLKWLVMVPLALIVISTAWFVIIFWYLFFGIFLVPYRLMRRSSRNNKREQLRHREVLEAVQRKNQ